MYSVGTSLSSGTFNNIMKTILVFSTLPVFVAIALAQYDDDEFCNECWKNGGGEYCDLCDLVRYDGDMYDDREDSECKDTISKEKCEAKKAKGRCETEKGKKKCPLTCGVCTATTREGEEESECKDTISKEKCEAKKAKGRCETEKGKKKCPLTCGVCTATTN